MVFGKTVRVTSEHGGGIDHDTAGAPEAGRGMPLAIRDEPTRKAIAKLRSEIDRDAVTALSSTSTRSVG